MAANVNYLIDRVIREIPKEVLDLALNPKTNYGIVNTSLDFRIQRDIIDNILLKDCNIIAGQQVEIDLSRASYKFIDGGYLINIPPGATGGKRITSVLSMSYGAEFSGAGTNLVDSFSDIPRNSDCNVELVGPNVVFAEGISVVVGYYLRCVVENSSDFANISGRALFTLGDLAVKAAQGFIHNELKFRVGKGIMQRGKSIDEYEEVISSYSDAYEIYNEMITTTWTRITPLADNKTKKRLIRAMSPKR